MNVSVFGLGDVGCVTAACLARNGHHVIGVDVDIDKVSMVNAGQSPIVEPGLGDLVRKMAHERRLRATTDTAEALAGAHAALICVGTPSWPYEPLDVQAIDHVARDIGAMLGRRNEPLTVVLRTAGLPGTTERVLQPAFRAGLGAEIRRRVRLAVNPHFMREGSSLADFDAPPMILVGTDDPAAAALVRTMYVGVRAPFVQTSIRTAELAKFAADAYQGLKVRFASEMAELAHALGADANVLTRIVAIDRDLRSTAAYLRPEFAFAGSCLPEELRALVRAARVRGIEVPVLSSVVRPTPNQGCTNPRRIA